MNDKAEGYIRIKTLGRGAYGQAVLYQKIETKTLVVWKEILLEKLRKNKHSEREIENEIEVLRLICHPNITMYYNHYVDEANLYIEMEYANGGSLYEKIYDQKGTLFEETIVLWYFYQILSALDYIHGRKILHRDIKTLNIFLTRSEIVKIGDFGLSKILEDDQSKAETNVGTPYYMSPELVQGLSYGVKSDIWAAGCVLHELLTLEKTFMATNTLKIAANVMKGKFQPIDSSKYSKDIIRLTAKTLTVDPDKRPTASEVLASSILASKIEGSSLEPQRQEGFETYSRKVASLALSATHVAVVTLEAELYTWNINNSSTGGNSSSNCGQLGHGNESNYRQPKLVSFFRGRQVKTVACGDEFTVCLLAIGSVFTFGSNYNGCLGCGEGVDKSSTPLEINVGAFGEEAIRKISCGDAHVVAMTIGGHCYSWGCGEHGRLGLNDEDDRFVPTRLTDTIPRKALVVDVVAGADRTFFQTKTGRLLACGNNDEGQCGWSAKKSTSKCRPILVKKLVGLTIESVAIGPCHTLVVTDTGRVYAFGRNSNGELGQGDRKKGRLEPCRVESKLAGHRILRVACADGLSLAASNDTLFTWGTVVGSGGQGLGDSGTGATNSLPRPIFGTLSNIVVLRAKNFTCAIVAERHTVDKHVQQSSSSVALSLSAPDNRYNNAETKFASSAKLPNWLQEEFEEADYIPAEQHESSSKVPSLKSQSKSLSAVNEDTMMTTIGDDKPTIEDSRQLLSLRDENERLKRQVSDHQKRIATLESKLAKCVCSRKSRSNVAK